MESAELQVGVDELRAEAGWCESLASRLAGNGAPTGAGPSVLASAVAANAAHAQIAAAGVRCTLRVQATATKLAEAAEGYGANESSSVAPFRALVPETVC